MASRYLDAVNNIYNSLNEYEKLYNSQKRVYGNPVRRNNLISNDKRKRGAGIMFIYSKVVSQQIKKREIETLRSKFMRWKSQSALDKSFALIYNYIN